MRILKKIPFVLFVSIAVCLIFSGCQTGIGLIRDIEGTAEVLDRTFTPVEQKLRQDRIDRATQLVLDNKGSK